MSNKIAILYFLIFSLLPGLSCTQEKVNRDWTYIDFKYNTGPLPPNYYYEYICRINNDGSSMLIYSKGYSDTIPPGVYGFNLSKDTIQLLNKLLIESKILDEEIEPLDDSEEPTGGSIRYVSVILADTNSNADRPPYVRSSPAFPAGKYEKGLNDLYDFITGLVPSELWKKVKKD